MNSELFATNSETAFLSLLMRHPELIYESSSATVGMFTSTPNQVIYASLQELSALSLIPEKQLLIDYLNSRNKLSFAGGEQYLTTLFEQNYSLENFATYREMLINSYRSRTLYSAVTDVPAMITGGHDVDRVISDLRYKLDSLEGDGIGSSTIRVSDSIADVWKTIVSRTENPGLTGISTGFRSIDMFAGGYPPGDFWVYGARPSQGKTALICNSALASSANNGIPLIFSLEMTKQTLVERFLSILSGVSLSSIRLGTVNQNELDAVHNATSVLKELPIFIDTNFSTNITYATSVIRKYVKTFNVNTVWIDYVQLMSERNEDQTAEIGRICRGMKLLAKDLGIFIGMTAQLNRMVEMRNDKRPILSDLRQSGNLEEDADLVAVLYRDDYYYADSKDAGIMEFIVRKHRNGPVGMLPLKFEKETTKITDV